MGVEIHAIGDHFVPRGVAQPDGVLKRQTVAIAGFGQDFAIVGARVLLPQEQRADAGLPQDVAQFVGAIRGIHVDQGHAGARRAVLEQNPLQAIGGPDAGAVAGAKAQASQPAGGAGGLAVQSGPGQAHVLVADDQGVAVRELTRGIGQHLRNGLFDEGYVRPPGIAKRPGLSFEQRCWWHESSV